MLNVPRNVIWDVTAIDNVTRKEILFKVDTHKDGIVNFNNTGSPLVTNPIVVTEPIIDTTPPVVVNSDYNYSELNREYFIQPKVKLVLPTRENSYIAQKFKISQNGKLICEYDRPYGWNTESSYMGNHPLEWQPAVENGRIDVLIENKGNSDIIAGFTTGDKYAFYDLKGELAKTNIHKVVKPNETWNFNQEIRVQKYSTKLDWSKTKVAWFFHTLWFEENGQPTTDKIICLTRENGLEITEPTETYKFYKEHNPSKNITIEFTTRGENGTPSFRVLHKQGIDIKPDLVSLTCFDITEGKIFNNKATGYVDYRVI